MNLPLAARLQLTVALALALTGTPWGCAAGVLLLADLLRQGQRRTQLATAGTTRAGAGSAAGLGVLPAPHDRHLLDPARHPGGRQTGGA